MEKMRIASFLPAATEMVYNLGLDDRFVGRTHECDYPPEAKKKPVLVDCAMDLSRMTAVQIDAAVSRRIASGKSLYRVDEARLRRAAPTLLITQNLCQVCGPAGNEVSQVLKTLRPVPEILWQTPRSFEEVLGAFLELGRRAGRAERARRWITEARVRIKRISEKTKRNARIRVSFIEWVDPIYCGGHWIPKMIEWAGGQDINSRDGEDSVRIPWNKIRDFRPEIIFVSPCGFKSAEALKQSRLLTKRPGWKSIPAVISGKVYALDANSYFARPGPRLVDGVELLAHLIHPEIFPWRGPRDAYRSVRKFGV